MKILLWPLYPIVLVLSFLTGLVPTRVAYALTWLIGSLAYFVLPGRRRVMAANYAPVLGKPPNHPDIRRAARLSLRNFVRYCYDFLRFPHLSLEEIDQRVALHVEDHFLRARELGKGLIFVSAHFGNMDYPAVAVAKHIVPVTVVADLFPPKALMDRLADFRAKKGVKIVYGAAAPRAALEALRRNEAVAFLLDVGSRRDSGVSVTFFGRRTIFPSGPALLSMRTGAPIVVGYGLVVNNTHVAAHSYPPIYARRTGDKEYDVQECSQAIARHFEDFISRAPEQWYMYRPMWVEHESSEAREVPGGDSQRVERIPEGTA